MTDKAIILSDGEGDALHSSPFEQIRREAEDGNEYWSARDLAKILGYTEFGKFRNAIQKAEIACENRSSRKAILRLEVRKPSWP